VILNSGEIIMLKRIQYIDDVVLDWIGRLHTPLLNRIMIFFSVLGTKGTIWLIICIPFLTNKQTIFTGVNILVAISITAICGEGIIKHLVCRMRPCHKLEDEDLIVRRPSFYSFPSGHTASSFAVATVAIIRCSVPIWCGILAIALLIAFSRIYLRVHYLTDVVCGILLGILCGVASVFIMDHLILSIK
jgi:undecaprenyl-diphosphatase